MLFSRRRRQAELAAREAAGESFWTSSFEERARRRIVFAAIDGAGGLGADMYFKVARDKILRDEGNFFLTRPGISDRTDIIACLVEGPDEMVVTAIEAFSVALTTDMVNNQTGNWHGGATFDSTVNTVLREHRISYELIDHRMVGFESREMHTAVVAPALTLLDGLRGWGAVERTYQDALREIARGSADDAITDAGTALQEALTVLGCKGNQLGDLIKSGKAQGLFAPHDDKVLSWVAADRSQRGDAHYASSANVEDAWFTVHVVGAIILRLAHGGPRAV